LSTTPQPTSTPGAFTIPRCQHIKTNGVQCGSPALRTERLCFFHHQHRRRAHEFDVHEPAKSALTLPTLEDANSIQLALAELMRLVVTQQIELPTASLLLRILRTASSNLKLLSLEPKPSHVVIDPNSVADRPLGATAWSTTEGREYDIIEEKEEEKEEPQTSINGAANIRRLDQEFNKDRLENEIRLCEEAIRQRIAGTNLHLPPQPHAHREAGAPEPALSLPKGSRPSFER
jgi:hypothetical protein